MICLLGIIIVIIGVIIDQVTKYFASSYIKDNPIIIIEDILELRYLENRGAAFGMLQNQQWFFRQGCFRSPNPSMPQPARDRRDHCPKAEFPHQILCDNGPHRRDNTVS